MGVEVKQITTRREKREFIYLPTRIHRSHPGWVPPIYVDEWRFLNPKKNRAFSHCETTLALAFRDGHVVGRIMGIINNRYNEQRHEKTARFGCLECFEEQEVAHSLLGYVEQWARERGMRKIVGPMGFSDQDPEGFLVEGFEHEPALATYHNFQFIIHFLEADGYTKDVDFAVYKIPVPAKIPKFYEKISTRVRKRSTYSLVEFTRRRELKPFIRPILQLMNETFRSLSGFTPLDDKEMSDLARRYLPIIDPRFVKVVTADNQMAGFIVGVPNMNEGLRKANGRLLPFGWFHVINAKRKTRRLDLLLGGIKERHRGRGVDVLLGGAMLRTAQSAGFDYIDSHHELESNFRVRAEMERLGGEVYKRYRIFQKRL